MLDDLAALAGRRSPAPSPTGCGWSASASPSRASSTSGCGTLLRAPNLGWTQVAIAAELECRLGLQAGVVAVGNEANLAALAELWDGVALDLSSFIHVTGQVGVGAGIVIDGELYRGSRGFAGELGHMTVRPDGDPCACGARGCLETVAGLEAIRAPRGMARRDGAGEYETAELLAQRAAAHDGAAITAIDEAAEALGIALVVRGQPARPRGARARRLLTPLARGWCRGCGMRSRPACSRRRGRQFDVRGSVLGVQAPVRGAAAIHLRAVLNRPWLVADSLGLVPGRPRPRGSAGAASVGS